MAPTAATPAWIHINDPAISGQIPARRGSRPPGLRGTGGAGELRALHHARRATIGARSPTASPDPGRGSATDR